MTALMPLGMLTTSLSHCCWVTLCHSWRKKLKQLSFFGWHVTIHLPLDHIPEVFSGVQI